MNNWRYKLMQFMQGRRGMDALGMFLTVAGFIIQLLGNILRIRIIYYIGILLFFIALFRMFSKNLYKRERENQTFIMYKDRLLSWTGGWRANTNRGASQNAGNNTVYCFYYCPSCKQQVRIPAGKGKVRVTCPTCKEKFEIIS